MSARDYGDRRATEGPFRSTHVGVAGSTPVTPTIDSIRFYKRTPDLGAAERLVPRTCTCLDLDPDDRAWEGRFNPIVIIDGIERPDELVDAFRPDFIPGIGTDIHFPPVYAQSASDIHIYSK
jgi:hypothetical protein